MRFPDMKVRDLQGNDLLLPVRLSGPANAVVLAFEREHQRPVGAWMTDLKGIEASYPGLDSWVLVAVPRSARLARSRVERELRDGLTDPYWLRHTLVAYVDVKVLLGRLGTPRSTDPHFYLLDAIGEVVHQEAGSPDSLKLTRVAAAVSELLPRTA
jgi:hypothetical protein